MNAVNVLAEKKSREVQAIYFTGKNADQVKAFCPHAATNDAGELGIESQENVRILEVGDFVINGSYDDYWASGKESFVKNYLMDGFDFDNPDPEVRTFHTAPKFVHSFRFQEDRFEEAVAFVESQGIEGARLVRDTPFGLYKITHPTREDYEVKDGEIIVCDFRRLYPCKRDIFLKTYDVLGEEVSDPYVENDTCRVYRVSEPMNGIYNGYMFENTNHEFYGISFNEGYHQQEDVSKSGISDMAMLRVLLDRAIAISSAKEYVVTNLYGYRNSVECALNKLTALM